METCNFENPSVSTSSFTMSEHILLMTVVSSSSKSNWILLIPSPAYESACFSVFVGT